MIYNMIETISFLSVGDRKNEFEFNGGRNS